MLAQGKTFSVAGVRSHADKAMARLKAVSAEVQQSSITLQIPLAAWQPSWFHDESSKRAAHAVLDRIASQHAVWYDFKTAAEVALLNPSRPGTSSGSEPLLSLDVNGHHVKVSFHCDTLYSLL